MFHLGELILLLLLNGFGFGLAKNNYEVRLNKFQCDTPKGVYVNELNCILHRQSKPPLLSVRFNLNETIESFNMQLIFDLIKKDNSRLNVADIKMDGCKYLSSYYETQFFGKFYKRIMAVSVLPKSCPIEAKKLFSIRNYTIIADDFPPGAPQSKWQMRLKVLNKMQLYANVLFEGAVVYKT
ncbi:uncharacterized protein [Drosophila tropicalis]|uniref:uncharacterized protein n=1 Tax=Drosophila tropicalis TaxID=46794 RepID=UPI0035AB8995